MSDQRLRELLRKLQTGDQETAVALYVARQRIREEKNFRNAALEVFVSNCKCCLEYCVNSARCVEYNADSKVFVPTKKVGMQYMHAKNVHLRLVDDRDGENYFFSLTLGGPGNSISAVTMSVNPDMGYYWVWNPEESNFDFIDNGAPSQREDWPDMIEAAKHWISKNLDSLANLQRIHVIDRAKGAWWKYNRAQEKLIEARNELSEALLAEPGWG